MNALGWCLGAWIVAASPVLTLSAQVGLRGTARQPDGLVDDTFDGGWVSADPGTASVSGTDTVLVVKTFAAFTPWKLHQLERYAEQLQRLGFPVAVLRDAATLRRNGQWLGDGKVRNSFVMLSSGKSIPLCDVSWQAAINEWGEDTFNGFSPVGGGHNDPIPGRGVHNQYEALWWRHCRPTGAEQHVWFVEDDAVFNGDVGHFLEAFSGDGADLVSSSFRIAGRHWWNFEGFNHSLSAGSLQLFDAGASGLVENVSPLPPLSTFPCGDSSEDTQGLIFRQDVVERWSSKLFALLDKALQSGVLGPSEAFLSTLCASDRASGSRCTMLDWAPVLQRDSGVTWASPLWCWGGFLRGRQCDAGWQDKWIHPVKVSSADALACASH